MAPMGELAMKAYSIDLRVRVVEAYNKKEGTIRSLATRFAIHWRTVSNWVSRFKKDKSVGPKQQKYGSSPKIDEFNGERLESLIKKQPDLTMDELRDSFLKLTNIEVSSSTIWRELNRRSLSRKKNSLQPLKQTKKEHGNPSKNL